MRIERFREYLMDRLTSANDPRVADVSLYEVRGQSHPLQDVRVRDADGVTFYLRIVRTSPGGENYDEDEKIVEKSTPGVEVVRR